MTMALASLSPQVNHGEVFTKPWVAAWILDLVGYRPTAELADSIIIEPACGNGVFVLEIVRRFVESCELAGVDPSERRSSIVAFDLNPDSVAQTRAATAELLSNLGVNDGEALAKTWVRSGDFLLDKLPVADFVVGNPPYVRLEEIDPDVVDRYRKACATMGGRADLYVGFYERGLSILRSGGRLGFICADRWMRNSYGKGLRSMIVEGDYAVEANITLHDVDCFEDEVSAYPAITVVSAKNGQGGNVIIRTNGGFGEKDAHRVTKFVETGKRRLSRASWDGVRLDQWFGAGMWPEGSADELTLLSRLESAFDPLEDVFKLTRAGIGVATGADNVFVTTDPDLVERDRLLPLAMHRHIADGELRWEDTYLVDPWDTGGLVDLERFPRLRAYFEEHLDSMAGRHVARKNPQAWFRTIDRVNHWLTDTPKILLADMKSRITPVVEPGGLYPHHNLYWVTSERWPIKALAGLLMSDYANLFVKAYCVKMRGGTLRFQTQYLRQIRLPDPTTISTELLTALSDAYDRGDLAAVNEAAEYAYERSLPELRRAV